MSEALTKEALEEILNHYVNAGVTKRILNEAFPPKMRKAKRITVDLFEDENYSHAMIDDDFEFGPSLEDERIERIDITVHYLQPSGATYPGNTYKTRFVSVNDYQEEAK